MDLTHVSILGSSGSSLVMVTDGLRWGTRCNIKDTITAPYPNCFSVPILHLFNWLFRHTSMPSHQLKIVGPMHYKAYSICDLLVRWDALVPTTLPMVYTIVLKGRSNRDLICSFPDWDSVPSEQCWLIISSKEVSPPHAPDRATGFPLINKPVRK